MFFSTLTRQQIANVLLHLFAKWLMAISKANFLLCWRVVSPNDNTLLRPPNEWLFWKYFLNTVFWRTHSEIISNLISIKCKFCSLNSNNKLKTCDIHRWIWQNSANELWNRYFYRFTFIFRLRLPGVYLWWNHVYFFSIIILGSLQLLAWDVGSSNSFAWGC